MRDLHELGVTPTRASAGRPPADDLSIAAFEKRFGVRVPEDLRKFLKEISGGYPRLGVFRRGGRSWEVNNFFGLARDDAPESLSDVTAQLAHLLGPGEIPFAQDGGGNPFIVEGSKTPCRVFMILLDEYERRVPVADSFGEFIDGLEDVPDDEL
jgi:cell wall assembly regulator SMI1